MAPRTLVARAAVREFLTHDLGPLRGVAARTAYVAARTLLSGGSASQQTQALKLLLRLHSGAFSSTVDAKIVELLREALRNRDGRDGRALSRLFRETAAEAAGRHRTSTTPTRILGARALVIKRWKPGERGVLVVDYSYVFPLMLGLFDLARVTERYTVVLEPSWAGASNPDILLFSETSSPVHVQTIEPRDRDFLNALETNLRVVPLAANWWVDPRRSPPPGVDRDIDVIMVAAWADIKRHWRVFRALGELKRRGHELKVALVGYRYDRTRQDIEALAAHFGILDQVQTYERIPQDEVSGLLARSKVHVLWSRRECANRAIVEAMLADVPVIVREGLTFGFRYPYINEHTGRFVPERQLGDAILEMLEARGSYQPRRWVLQHMTCERATSLLEEHLRDASLAAGQPWTEGLVVKTSTLDTQRYFNPEDSTRFERDYQYLEACLRPD